MKVVITGASGLLGKYMVQECPQDTKLYVVSRRHAHFASGRVTDHSHGDLRNTEDFLRTLEAWRPDAVIHCAAEGSVDAVEGRSSEFREINVEVPGRLAQWCRRRGVHFGFVSSNAVFGGGQTPIGDDAVLSPINDYGRLKAEAERVVLTALDSSFIPRPILMYGWPQVGGRINPVAWWVSELRKGNEVRVVDDVISEPIAAWDVARGIWAGMQSGCSGTVNLGGGVPISLYSFALLTAEIFGLNADLIQRASSSDFPALAPRPSQTMFVGQRMRNDLGLEPAGPARGLSEMLVGEGD